MIGTIDENEITGKKSVLDIIRESGLNKNHLNFIKDMGKFRNTLKEYIEDRCFLDNCHKILEIYAKGYNILEEGSIDGVYEKYPFHPYQVYMAKLLKRERREEQEDIMIFRPMGKIYFDSGGNEKKVIKKYISLSGQNFVYAANNLYAGDYFKLRIY